MNSDWDRLHILAGCQNYSHYKNAGFGSAQPENLPQLAEDWMGNDN